MPTAAPRATVLRRRRALVGAAAAIAALMLASACGSGVPETVERERSGRAEVPFTGCDKIKCDGEIDGAAYKILLPAKWNGTLLLWSHGYRQLQAAPPEFKEPSRAPDPAPRYADGNTAVADQLLSKGYALAGSAYSSNGWAVKEGIEAGEKLHDFFVRSVGTPDRVYVWGESLGGLVTAELAQRHPDWVTASAPTCGVLAGAVDNLDLALDVAYAVKTLLYPQLKLTGFASWDEAVANWQGAYKAILAASKDVANGVPRIVMVAAIADAPGQTRSRNGATIQSQIGAYAEAVLTALGYGTFGRFDIEQRVKGNPSDNTASDYSQRVAADERRLLETISAGSTDRLLKQLADGERVSADAAARAEAGKLGAPSGELKDPTITMHTIADPLVLVQNERLFRDRVAQRRSSGNLAQVYIAPPRQFDEKVGAPYGAGHCVFSPESYVGLVDVLDAWARNGIYPGSGALEAAIGVKNGLNLAYQPPEWPAGPRP